MAQFTINTKAKYFSASGLERRNLSNGGGGTLYYSKSETVSAVSNEGNLVAGETLEMTYGLWLISASQTGIEIFDAVPEPGGGEGVIGPGKSVDTDLAIFNGTTGKRIKDSGVLLSSVVRGSGAGVGTKEISGQTFNTGAILQSIASANLGSGSEILYQGQPIGTAQLTEAAYEDSGSGQIFHHAVSISNTGTRTVVASFNQAAGVHIFATNDVAYGNSSSTAPSVIGCEIDFGNVGSVAPASLAGLNLVTDGGNIGGAFPPTSGSFIQITTNNALSQVPFGIKFNGGTYQPIGTQTGTKIQGTLTKESKEITGVTPTAGYSNGDYITGKNIPAGSTIVSGAGTETLTISEAATGSGAIANGGAFVFTSGTGTLISGGGGINAIGLDLSNCIFSNAAIALPKKGAIKLSGGQALGRADLQVADWRGSKFAVGCTLPDPSLAASSSAALTSGTLYIFMMPLLANDVVASLAACPNGIGSEVTGLWYLVMDSGGVVRGFTKDLKASLSTVGLDGTLVAGSGASWTVPQDQHAYFGLLCTFKGTSPTFRSFTASTEVSNYTVPSRAALSNKTTLTEPPALETVVGTASGYGSLILGGAF